MPTIMEIPDPPAPSSGSEEAGGAAGKDKIENWRSLEPQPVREGEVENAVKFLSHSKVRGSPVVYRRSFLERKGLSKEEIDEAFRRVPDSPAETATAVSAAGVSQQRAQQSTVQVAQKTRGWTQMLLAFGVLTAAGAGAGIVTKNYFIPKLREWILEVVSGKSKHEQPSELSPVEEAASAAAAAATAASQMAGAIQQISNCRSEDCQRLEALVKVIDAQIQEIKMSLSGMKDAVQNTEATKPQHSMAKNFQVNNKAEFQEGTEDSMFMDVTSAIPTFLSMAASALGELHLVFNRCDMMKLNPSTSIVHEIMLARNYNIVCHGVGREGLMMRSFTMRLFHLGLKASCLGDMTTPKLGPGDLFIASAGPGSFSSVDALMLTAKEAGARVLLVTSQPEGDAAKIAHEVAWLPAQTMKDKDSEAGQLAVDQAQEPNSISISERPMEKPYTLSEPALDMVDKHTKEEAKTKEKTLGEAAGEGLSDNSMFDKEMKEKKDEATGLPKSPKSPQAGKDMKLKGEIGLRALLGKEKIPQYMIPLKGSHLDHEVTKACKENPENICLLVDEKILPMGSVYEGAMYILFEVVIYTLRVRLGETLDGMCERHTNME